MIRLNTKWFLLGTSVAALTLSSAVAGNPNDPNSKLSNSLQGNSLQGTYYLEGDSLQGNSLQGNSLQGHDYDNYSYDENGTLIYAPFEMTGKGQYKVQKQIDKDWRRVQRQNNRAARRSLREQRRALRHQSAPGSSISSVSVSSMSPSHRYSNYDFDRDYGRNYGRDYARDYNDRDYRPSRDFYYDTDSLSNNYNQMYTLDENGNLIPYGQTYRTKPSYDPAYEPSNSLQGDSLQGNSLQGHRTKPINDGTKVEGEIAITKPGTVDRTVDGTTVVVYKPGYEDTALIRKGHSHTKLCGVNPCNTAKQQRQNARANKRIARRNNRIARIEGRNAKDEAKIAVNQRIIDACNEGSLTHTVNGTVHVCNHAQLEKVLGDSFNTKPLKPSPEKQADAKDKKNDPAAPADEWKEADGTNPTPVQQTPVQQTPVQQPETHGDEDLHVGAIHSVNPIR